jgi:hypothetical protein
VDHSANADAVTQAGDGILASLVRHRRFKRTGMAAVVGTPFFRGRFLEHSATEVPLPTHPDPLHRITPELSAVAVRPHLGLFA